MVGCSHRSSAARTPTGTGQARWSNGKTPHCRCGGRGIGTRTGRVKVRYETLDEIVTDEARADWSRPWRWIRKMLR